MDEKQTQENIKEQGVCDQLDGEHKEDENAHPCISKIKIGDICYNVKDEELRKEIEKLIGKI